MKAAWTWGLLVAVSGALALGVYTFDAGDAPASLAVGAWGVGDEVTYHGPQRLTFTVDGPSRALLRDGQPVEALAVVVEGDTPWTAQTQFVLPHAGVMAVEVTHCGQMEGGTCKPIRLASWRAQGRPALLGASLVMNRTLTAGDEWEAPFPCAACKGPLNVRVREADADAPPGALVTVEFGDGRTREPRWDDPRGRMHLGASHPYPLRVDLGDESYVLAELRQSGRPLPPLREAPEPASGIPSRPFEGGRPVEGRPFAPYPTWREAREATAPPTGEGAPSACASWEYAVSHARSSNVLTGEAHWREYLLKETCSHAGGSWLATTYRGEDPQAGPLEASSGRSWSRARTETGPPLDASCAAESPPVWDAVRFAMSLGLLDQFGGHGILGGCDDRVFYVTGGPIQEGAGIVPAESATLDARTGLLVSARFSAATDAIFAN